MFKRVTSLLLIMTLVLTLGVGCSTSGKKQENKKQGAKNKGQVRVGMVTDVGGVNDQSFNQSAWEGLQRAEKELGIKASYQESKQDADYIPNLETLLDGDNDLIWGIGYKVGDALREAAESNPDQKYAIVDYSYGDKTPENVVGVVFKAEQSSFLVGYIAGKMSQTGKVGFVGGIKSNIIDGFDYGYHAGVAYANKLTNKGVQVLRQYAESFDNPAKGKAIANSMYQQGADIVFHAAGGVGDGVIESAKEQGKYAIGVDRDQNYLAPDNVITSAMKRVDVGIYDLVKALKEGKFEGGKTIVYGLEHNAVDIAPTSNKHVPKEILDEVEKLKKDIVDGKINVPNDEKTYKDYLNTLK
ncbi:putative ABC-type transport system, periplasmic component/surface lipoprotein [Gottschalkia purinilytica]|uniref:Putative ABC-type transport system, periplasmic component/surface lipoprotein n=1 Tax=Gottschalkia purinilytica TaxID=1503 RepID=A0A0L0WFB6_GOTPU|nr:BMP family ABC transporter substrate-binding protein [Gottschalkia purinilytica]KNF10126.1 putative ABC-type transport system, periplasmic component/surface lipoprotein [Gottschalkia purinilytica]